MPTARQLKFWLFCSAVLTGLWLAAGFLMPPEPYSPWELPEPPGPRLWRFAALFGQRFAVLAALIAAPCLSLARRPTIEYITK